MTNQKMTIFFDGQCPMCQLEMAKLQQHDQAQKIDLVDLHSQRFAEHFPEVDFAEAMAVLHGYYQGRTLRGLEVTHRAWTLVGKGFWVAPLNWPIIKPISHQIYLLVAKYRHPISNFLHKRLGIGHAACDTQGCNIKQDKS